MSFTKVAPAGIGTEPGSEIKVGDSLLHSTGIDLGSGTGIGATITRQGNATFTGIVTASSFSGILAGGASELATNATGTNLTLSGNLGVGGTLTYEDVTNIDSVGIITARSTVSIADSIIHTGDTNTSLRFPTTDTITAETAGKERLRIGSNGYVGIGTNNATELVDIRSTDSAAFRLYTLASSSNAVLGLRSGDSGNSRIKFGDTADDDEGELRFQNVGNILSYHVNGGFERLRIGPAGQIGILGAFYGTSGEVLRSRGSLQAPEWASPLKSGGSFTMDNTSGEYQFNTIPDYAQKITFAFVNLSAGGSNNTIVQLGTSSGMITSGYYSQTTNGEGSKQNITNGFSLYTTGASHSYSGAMVIYKVSSSKYSYTYTGTNGVAANRMGAGRLSGISGTIDRLLFKTSGTNNFDAGEVIIYAE